MSQPYPDGSEPKNVHKADNAGGLADPVPCRRLGFQALRHDSFGIDGAMSSV